MTPTPDLSGIRSTRILLALHPVRKTALILSGAACAGAYMTYLDILVLPSTGGIAQWIALAFAEPSAIALLVFAVLCAFRSELELTPSSIVRTVGMVSLGYSLTTILQNLHGILFISRDHDEASPLGDVVNSLLSSLTTAPLIVAITVALAAHGIVCARHTRSLVALAIVSSLAGTALASCLYLLDFPYTDQFDFEIYLWFAAADSLYSLPMLAALWYLRTMYRIGVFRLAISFLIITMSASISGEAAYELSSRFDLFSANETITANESSFTENDMESLPITGSKMSNLDLYSWPGAELLAGTVATCLMLFLVIFPQARRRREIGTQFWQRAAEEVYSWDWKRKDSQPLVLKTGKVSRDLLGNTVLVGCIGLAMITAYLLLGQAYLLVMVLEENRHGANLDYLKLLLMLILSLGASCVAWFMKDSPKLLILFLRKFRNEPLNTALARFVSGKARSRVRVATLDDGVFVPLGVAKTSLFISLIIIALALVPVTLLLGLSISAFYTGWINVVSEAALYDALFSIYVGAPSIVMFGILSGSLAYMVILGVRSAKERRLNTDTLQDFRRISILLRQMTSRLRSKAMLSPASTSIVAHHSWWQFCVRFLSQHSDAVILDCSSITENIKWELDEMSECRSDSLILAVESGAIGAELLAVKRKHPAITIVEYASTQELEDKLSAIFLGPRT